MKEGGGHKMAMDLVEDLKRSPMRVILIPAPDPRHSGHKIRVVESRPPRWYMEFVYPELGRKTFKRHRFIEACKRVAKGNVFGTIYEKLALKIIEMREQGDEEGFV